MENSNWLIEHWEFCFYAASGSFCIVFFSFIMMAGLDDSGWTRKHTPPEKSEYNFMKGLLIFSLIVFVLFLFLGTIGLILKNSEIGFWLWFNNIEVPFQLLVFVICALVFTAVIIALIWFYVRFYLFFVKWIYTDVWIKLTSSFRK